MREKQGIVNYTFAYEKLIPANFTYKIEQDRS